MYLVVAYGTDKKGKIVEFEWSPVSGNNQSLGGSEIITFDELVEAIQAEKKVYPRFSSGATGGALVLGTGADGDISIEIEDIGSEVKHTLHDLPKIRPRG